MAKKKKKLPTYMEDKLKVTYTPKNEKQKELYDYIINNEITIVKGVSGSGKTYVTLAAALNLLGDKYKQIILVKSLTTVPEEALGYLRGPQPLFSKVSTPSGWVEMGDLKIGDYVHAYDGSTCSVTNISSRNKEDYYKITTSDGRVTHASTMHKWFVEQEDRSAGTRKNITVTTKDMLNDPDRLYHLPIHKSVEYDKVELKLDPYLIGILIGDGSITGSHTRFSTNDIEIVERITDICKQYDLKVKHQPPNKYTYTISAGRNNSGKGSRILARRHMITNEVEVLGTLKNANKKLGIAQGKPLLVNRCTKNSKVDNWEYYFTGEVSRSANYVKEELEDLELLGKRAWEKSIPKDYLYSSKKDRINLLNGLMDSDGTIKPNGSDTAYITTSKQLAEDVSQLVQSLGGLVTIKEYDYTGRVQEREGFDDIVARRVSYTVYIKFYSDEVNPFWLKRKADRFKPTSNYKYSTRIKNIELVGQTEVQCITIDHPSKLYLTDSFIPTHNSLEEKMDPYIMSYAWTIDKLCGYGASKDLMDKKLISVLPIAFARGISIDNSIVIVDEIQNLSKHTFKTLITRIGDNSKYIFMGDVEQIDRRNKSDSPLELVYNIFKDSNIVGTVEFTDEDCVRNPIIPEILSTLRENNI